MKLTLLIFCILSFTSCAHKLHTDSQRTNTGMAKHFNQKYQAAPHTDGSRIPACKSAKNAACKE